MQARPRTITKSDPSRIVIEWDDGTRSDFSAARLRAICPCARCVDEVTGRRVHDPRSVPAELLQTDARLVGNYGLALRFSDGHDTGIYSFTMLRESDPGAPRTA